MKNQYFADIGDYGKYGLLRFLASEGPRLAVNWYLTMDDNSNDGHFRDYLDKNLYRDFDPALFLTLASMHDERNYNVEAFEKEKVLIAKYYHEYIDGEGWKGLSPAERLAKRIEWHKNALEFCKGADLVFLDPDNGLSKNKVNGRLTSPKYVFLDEAYDYFLQGSDVVYYCHKGRRSSEKWKEAVTLLNTKDPDIHIRAITFHKGTQRTYVFAIHPENAEKYDKMIEYFLEKNWWKGAFTLEL